MMLAEATGFDLDARTVALRTAGGRGDARLRHADRRRRARSTTTSATRSGRSTPPSSRRSRARCTSARRSCGRSRRPRSPQTEEERERLLTFVVVGAGPDRRRDGRADRRDRPRHAARLPRHRHVARRRCCWSRPAIACWPRSRRSCRRRRDEVAREPRRDAAGRPHGHRHRRRRRDDRATERRARAATVIWAAGVLASGVVEHAGRGLRAPRPTSVGRLLVEPDLTLPGHPEVLAIGDMVQVRGARPAARRRAGGDADGALRGQAASRDRLRERRARAVQVQGQGQPGHDRAGARGRRPAAADPGQRLRRLGAVARDPPLLPGRLPEPAAGAACAGASASSRTGAGRG